MRAFEAVRAYNTYNAYNQRYNLYNECTRCLCLCLGLRLVGSEQHGTGSDKGVAAGRSPPGGPVHSTGKNSRSSRVTSALWTFVLYRKNAIVLSGIERTSPPGGDRPAAGTRREGDGGVRC